LVIGLLLGISLVAYPVTASPQAQPPAKACCGHCHNGKCCAAQRAPAAPVAPAPVPSSQNQLQALPLLVLIILDPSPAPAKVMAGTSRSSISISDIPLFERDCSYLL
jgi:hypothetical protein